MIEETLKILITDVLNHTDILETAARRQATSGQVTKITSMCQDIEYECAIFRQDLTSHLHQLTKELI